VWPNAIWTDGDYDIYIGMQDDYQYFHVFKINIDNTESAIWQWGY